MYAVDFQRRNECFFQAGRLFKNRNSAYLIRLQQNKRLWQNIRNI